MIVPVEEVPPTPVLGLPELDPVEVEPVVLVEVEPVVPVEVPVVPVVVVVVVLVFPPTTRAPLEVCEKREFVYDADEERVGNKEDLADTTTARAERKLASAA